MLRKLMTKSRLENILQQAPQSLNRRDRRAGRRLLQEEKKRVENMVAADELSGAGYIIDQQSRDLLKMVNEDLARGYDIPLPNLWDVFSAFIQKEDSAVLPFYRLRPEIDHAFDPNDFFAYSADPAIRQATFERLYALKEGVIYNFSALGSPKEVVFEAEDQAVFVGVAFVRNGDHLYWQSSGGYICDLEKETRERREMLAKDEERIRRVNAHYTKLRLRIF